MGAYLSKPITEKETEEGYGNRLSYGASCMQGWRVSQEDAHNCIPEYDENSSLFAVYDGHGGAEVAVYLSRHFPEFLKNTEGYRKGDWEAALHEAYVKIDAHIKTPEAMSELQKIAKKNAGDNEDNIADYDEENVGELYKEATMPIEALMAKYRAATGASAGSVLKEFIKEGEGDRPGSSKELVAQPSSCTSSASVLSSSSGAKVEQPEGNEVDEPQSSSSVKTPAGKSSTEPECTSISSSSNSGGSSSKQLVTSDIEETAEAETAVATDSPQVPNSSNENSDSMDVEPCSSTNEVDCEADSGKPKPTASTVNGIDESIEPDSTEDDSVKVVQQAAVNGNTNEVKVNGNSEADSTQADSGGSGEVKNTVDSPPKRKGKVHPPAPAVAPTPTRTSPRKKLDEAKVYTDFINEESASSDSDDDAVVKSFAENSDSDEENVAECNSSSSDDDEDVEEEEEDDDEDDDDDDDDDGTGNNQLLSDMQEPGYDSGSTAVVAFCRWEGDKLHLYVANAGDSRCVVSRNGQALEMSHDHKPEDETEARRIINAGGKVTQDGRVNSGLNLSRAIGDHSYKQNLQLPPEEQMITPVPDVKHEILDPSKDRFIVLACDGVWNSLSSQEVVDFVTLEFAKGLKEAQICERLFDACLAPDTTGDGTGCDNMTAIIVKLPELSASSEAEGQVTSVAAASNEQNKRRLSNVSDGDADESKRLKTTSE